MRVARVARRHLGVQQVGVAPDEAAQDVRGEGAAGAQALYIGPGQEDARRLLGASRLYRRHEALQLRLLEPLQQRVHRALHLQLLVLNGIRTKTRTGRLFSRTSGFMLLRVLLVWVLLLC